MEDFAGVTLDDLYRVETTFETNVCVYKLVESDEEDGKTKAGLVRRSLCHYQRDLGLGSLFGGLLRIAMPLVKRRAMTLGKGALKTGVRIADDVLSGQSIKRQPNDASRMLVRTY